MGTSYTLPVITSIAINLNELKKITKQYKTPFSSVQFSCSVVSDSVTPRTAARQASLPITNSQNLLKFMSIELVMPSNHLILCHPLLRPPSVFPSIRVFSNESALWIRWPKYWSFSFNISPSNEHSGLTSFRMDWLDLLAKNWSFSFSISPSNEHSGLTSFRMDWLDLLAVKGTLKRLFPHHSSKAPILRHSAFFIVQLSHHSFDYIDLCWQSGVDSSPYTAWR